MTRLWLDPASLTNTMAQKLNLDPDRLTVWMNRSTAGAPIIGTYISPECKNMEPITFNDDPIRSGYCGLAVEIQVYVPNDRSEPTARLFAQVGSTDGLGTEG